MNIGSVDDLEDALKDAWQRGSRVHVRGTGSWRAMRPPAEDATLVSTEGLQRIERLDPADLTCSVQPGTRRVDLEDALEEHGLCLPASGGNTIGGWCAMDPIGALAPGGFEPRHMVLGMEGMLVDGTRFKTGAKVVKSVAGFDLHKLFVGSEGRLFVATLLHLKVQPAPRAVAGFRTEPSGVDEAVRRMFQLRREPAAVATAIELAGDTAALFGRLHGRGRAVHAALNRHGLEEVEAPPWGAFEPFAPRPQQRLVSVSLPAGQLAAQWRAHGAELTGMFHGGNRLIATGAQDTIERLERDLNATSQRGASADLAQRVRLAFDPEQRLA